MKTKQITLEPYLTVLHSWKVLSEVLSSKHGSLESILRKEIEDSYQGEFTYYFNFVLKDSCSSFSTSKENGLLWSYIHCFKDSLDRLINFVFNNNGKIRNVQLYKQITSYVFKDILIFAYMKKNRIPINRKIPREFFYEVPYYIDNLRETHLHAGLAFDIFDIVEIAIRNFRQFEKKLKKLSESRTNRKKTIEVLERFRLIINLYVFLMCLPLPEEEDKFKEQEKKKNSHREDNKRSEENSRKEKTNSLETLISYVHRINRGLPIVQKIECLRKFSLTELLIKAISNLYELDCKKTHESNDLDKYLASVILLVNLNELLKVNTDRTLYKGLEHFSEEFIKKNPIKVAASSLVEKSSFFEMYKEFFKKEGRVKAFELRMYPNAKSLKFWHNAIKLMASEKQKQQLHRFLNSSKEPRREVREIRIDAETLERILKNQDVNLLAEILNCALRKNSEQPSVEKGIDKEFSLIFHFGKIKKPSEFEEVGKFYKETYRTAKKFANFLRNNREYVAFFSGIDAASMEYWTPAWVFAPLYSFWRNFAVHYIPALADKGTPLKFTYHAGEDFVDIGTGLKNIYEAIKFLNLGSGDRIGHTLALGTDVESYSLKHRKVRMSPLYYFFHLLWLNYMTYKHEELAGYRKRILREISQLENEYEFVRNFLSSLIEIETPEEGRKKQKERIHIVEDLQVLLVNLYEALKFDFINIGDTSYFGRLWNKELEDKSHSQRIVSILHKLFKWFCMEKKKKGKRLRYYTLDPLLDENSDLSFEKQIEFLKKIRKVVLKVVIEKGIVIESCPSSNVYIRGLVDYKDHLVLHLKEEIIHRELRVTLNTDDPLIFNNTLLDEYLLIHEALPEECKERVVRALIENSHNFAFGG